MNQLAQRALKAVENFSLTEISSRPLGLFRIFAVLSIIHQFTSKWAGFRFVDYPLCLVLSWVVLGSAWLVMVGYKTRWTTAIMALAAAGLHLYYGVHLGNYLLSKPVQVFQVMVLLAVTPCGRSLSIDRAIEVRRAQAEGREPEAERMPWWMVELFILQISAVYLWAAFNKSDDKWFRGERMERYWVKWYGGSDSMVYSALTHVIAVFLAWCTTILEYALAFGLLSRRLRPYLLWGGVMLHVGILFLFSVTYFSTMMLFVLGLCLPPRIVDEFVARLTVE